MQTTDPAGRSAGKSRRFVAILAGGVIAASAGLTLIGASVDSDAVIARGFERAFAVLDNRSAPARGFDGVAGTEDDWLRSIAGNEIVKVVAIGQEIRFSGNGIQRRLTITSVRDAGDAGTHINTSAVSSPVLLITCREGDDASSREIRLRLEGGHVSEVAADPIASAL